MKTYKAAIIARYFLSIHDEDSGELISNLKLQKLLYYSQGFYIALYDHPLFSDQIYAWMHGPVVKTVYQIYAKYGATALPKEKTPTLPGDIVSFLSEVYSLYGKYSAWKLREMTHREEPWATNHNPNQQDTVISHENLKSYFKTQLIS